MMTKIKLYTLITLALMCFCTLQAQNDTIPPPTEKAPVYNKLMDSNYKGSKTENQEQTVPDTEPQSDLNYSGQWVIGAGINMVEDSGNQTFSDYFTLNNKNWGLPFFISTEYLTNSRFSFSATFLINKYQTGKLVQGNTIQEGDEPNYMAVDLAAKMFFRKILHKHVFTPYITAGAGYSSISSYQAISQSNNPVPVDQSNRITLNTGIGAYYWFGRTWGINFNYIAKFNLSASNDIGAFKDNHLVSSFGVFYRFNNKNFK